MAEQENLGKFYYRRSPILAPVANPVTVAWVSFPMAVLNVVAHVVLLIFASAFADVSPTPFFASLGACHIGLIFVCNKEPHLFSILRASGQAIRQTKNIAPVKKGIKLVP